MKKYIRFSIVTSLMLLITLFCFGAVNQEKKHIQISGKVEFLNPDIFEKYNLVWLKKGLGSNAETVDSVKLLKDGNFNFTLSVNKPGFYQLDIVKWQTVTFWADDNIKLLSRGYDTANVKVKNSGFIFIESKSQVNQLINKTVYDKYLDQQFLSQSLAEWFAAQSHNSTDSTWYTYLRKQNPYRKIDKLSDDRQKIWLQTTDNNAFALYLISTFNRDQNKDYILSELDKILIKQPDFVDALKLKNEVVSYIDLVKKTQAGSFLPEIEYPGIDGKKIKLTSFRGKYVIVDFWASWCGPCRKSIPKLKELYAQYKSKGLEILSISIDTDDIAWRKAMVDESMPWIQMLSPNKDKTLNDFRIQGVPTMFLIDKTGKIVEKFTGYNPRLDELLKAKL